MQNAAISNADTLTHFKDKSRKNKSPEQRTMLRFEATSFPSSLSSTEDGRLLSNCRSFLPARKSDKIVGLVAESKWYRFIRHLRRFAGSLHISQDGLESRKNLRMVRWRFGAQLYLTGSVKRNK